MAKRAKPGDVLEVVVAPGGLIYLHYIGKHPHYGDCVAVCPSVHQARATVTAELFRDAYVTFYPATAAVAQGLATVVGHLPPPGVPKRLRRPGGVTRAGKILAWIIEDGRWYVLPGRREVVKEKLSADDRKLPIASIWNHGFLVDRVLEGYRPENEGPRERAAPDETAAATARLAGQTRGDTTPPAVQTVLHYLYFPEQKAAAEVAAQLRHKGFETEERMGADGVNWLVLAKYEIVPSEDTLEETRSVMEALAEAKGGEYDGSEVETAG